MPWPTGKGFASKHNKKLHGEAATKAAHVATALVEKGEDEGKAIHLIISLIPMCRPAAAAKTPIIWYGPHVNADTTSNVYYQQQSVLKTMMMMLGFPLFPQQATMSPPITEVFH